MSPYHFHRVFTAEVGEPLGRFVTRRRLEEAALRIAYTSHSITEIALSSGYSSSSNFTKAFGVHFGCSPSDVRRGSAIQAVGRLTRRHGKDFSPADLYTLPQPTPPTQRRHIAASMSVRFEETRGLTMACLEDTSSYDLHALSETWGALIDCARQLGFAGEDVDAWGFLNDSPALTPSEHLRYHAAVPCPPDTPLPPPLFTSQMHAGRYAVFAYEGPVRLVEAHYRRIYSCWFPESALSPADFVPLDRYVGDAPVDGRVQMEAWVRVCTRRW